MTSEMTSSATERELENGELKTAIPARAAASRSTWLVPMQKQPMTRSYADSEKGQHVHKVRYLTQARAVYLAGRRLLLTEGTSEMTRAVTLVLDLIPTAENPPSRSL